jgi:DNA-binding NarL/FixJ family response regulator
MRIFVVDDSVLLREQVVSLLSEVIGLEIVGQAQYALEAFHAICDLRPDVVILDIHLIGGSGIDVLRRIKRLNPAPIVIMLTNSTAPPYRRKCMRAGADFFLDKSSEFDHVRAIIQSLSDRINKPVAETPLGYFGPLRQFGNDI